MAFGFTELNPGTLGSKVAGDFVLEGGDLKEFQRLKIVHGAEGVINETTAANPFPVTVIGAITGPVTISEPVSVDDNGASLTVDSPQLPAALVGGRLDVVVGAALPAGANNIGDVDVVSSVLPTGAATSANQTTEITALQLIDDLPHAMNDAFNKGVAAGGQLDDVGTTAATENNIAPVRITAQRAFHTNLRNNAGTEVGTAAAPIRVDPTGTTTQPVSGTVAISGTVDTELPAAAALSDNFANPTAPAVGAFSMAWDGANWDRLVNGAGTQAAALRVVLPSDASPVATRQVASDATDATNVADSTVRVRSPSELTDNAAFTDGTSRVYPAGFIFDEVAGTALTENDAAAARIDSKRAQVFALEDATTRGQRAAVSSGGALEIQGEIAHDSPVAGFPVLQGLEGRTTNGTPVGNGDATRALGDTLGKTIVINGAVHDLWTSGRVTLTDTTAADVIGAGGAGVRIVVTKIAFTNASGAVPTKVEIRDGTTVKLQLSAEVFGGISMPAESPFFIGTANTAVSARCVTTGADVDVFISGYVINN